MTRSIKIKGPILAFNVSKRPFPTSLP